MRSLLALGFGVALAACIEASVVVCEDGSRCPPGDVCNEIHGGCLEPDQLSTCVGDADGADCTFGTGTVGLCRDEVCFPLDCGDGFVVEPEACDGALPDSLDQCTEHGFHQEGVVTCTSACELDTTACSEQCGDDVINGGEPCDGDDLGGLDCLDFGFYEPDGLLCTSGCTFDTGDCDRTCGDSTIDAADGEECDRLNLGAVSDCTDLDFYFAGTVTCSAQCRYDTSACTGACGDGVRNGAELCDGDDVPLGCQDLGFYDEPGIACSAGCTYDTGACTGFCGDRLDNGREVCEGRAPSGMSCGSLGFDGGTLGCLGLCAPDLSGCYDRIDVPLTQLTAFGSIPAVWAAPGDAYVAGQQLLHDSGAGWLSSGAPLLGVDDISGTAWNDVWALADDTIAHYDGAWDGGTNLGGLFFAVWAGADDVFVVGFLGAIQHRSGGDWVSMSSNTTANLNAVWGVDTDDVFAVGAGGTIVHWDGSAWSAQTSNTTADLWSVYAAASDDVYAVANNGLHHYDGTTWSPVTLPTTVVLRAVWGTSGDDVYVVGNGGTALHFDGTSWTIVPTGTTNALLAVGGSGSPDVIFAGASGTIIRHDGTRWSLVDETAMYVVTATGDGTIYGIDGNGGDILRYGAGGWTVVTTYAGYIASIDATPDGHVFAVGGNGTILHSTGGAWSPMTSGVTGTLTDVWATSGDHAVAVSNEGTILTYDGIAWTATTLPTSDTLYTVWGLAPDDVYTSGGGGRLFHYDGASWTQVSSTEATIYAFGGRHTHDVYAVGTLGTVGHYDGTAWTYSTPFGLNELDDIVVDAEGQVYLVGEDGRILREQGDGWELMQSVGSTLDYLLSAIAVGGRVYAAGDSGLFQLDRTCFPDERACGDGRDGDCDGAVDCADVDCDGDATCAAGGLCEGWAPIACGSTIDGSTIDGGAAISRYACSGWLDVGRELTYQLAPPAGDVTVTLTSAFADLDLIVLGEGAGGGCDPDAGCVAASSTTGVETVTFTAAADEAYYLVVDGYGGAAGDFTIAVSCP